jgi:hypothetical protein
MDYLPFSQIVVPHLHTVFEQGHVLVTNPFLLVNTQVITVGFLLNRKVGAGIEVVFGFRFVRVFVFLHMTNVLGHVPEMFFSIPNTSLFPTGINWLNRFLELVP